MGLRSGPHTPTQIFWEYPQTLSKKCIESYRKEVLRLYFKFVKQNYES